MGRGEGEERKIGTVQPIHIQIYALQNYNTLHVRRENTLSGYVAENFICGKLSLRKYVIPSVDNFLLTSIKSVQ